jgi:carbonic anhydrase/acetyltransferase-like protein (isoleucine patch superfamily)
MTIRSFDGVTPNVHDTAYLDDDATLIGNVILAEQANVWPGTVLRGDLEEIIIGPQSNVQDNAVAHSDPGFPTTVGTACTIGHGAVVHGTTVEDRSVIGMNATLLNGSVIGKNSIVAAGSVVTEGQEIPDGVLAAGAPAEIKTELDPDSEQLEAGNHYVELAKIYRE